MEEGLLAQTNAGGENVARGSTLGALYGAAGGMAAVPPRLIEGLADREVSENGRPARP
jgi:ADP-ribosyl-[dinitrogen reductase] hydrolase